MLRSSRSRLRVKLGWAGALGVVALLVILGVPEIGHAQVPVIVFKNGGGSGTVTSTGLATTEINCGGTCVGSGAISASVTLTAVADPGSTFLGWVGKGCIGTGTCPFTLNQASTAVAMFSNGPGGFSAADLAGTWYLSALTDYRGANSPGWTATTLELGGTGNFVSGTFTPSDSPAGSLSGATILVDPRTGMVSAEFMAAGGGGITIPFARLDQTKTMLASSVTEDPNGRGSSIGIKGGGTFTQADLAGTWHIATLSDSRTANDPSWRVVTLTFDQNGAFSNGTLTGSEGGGSIPIISAALTLDSAGQASGTLTFGSSTVTFVHGKLNPTKTILGLVSSESGNNRALSVGIKRGGTFSTADLAGTWYFGSLTDYKGVSNIPDWAVTRMTLNATGNLVEGSFQSSERAVGVLTAAALTSDADGVISGTISILNYGTLTVQNGKMDPSKSVIVVTISTASFNSRELSVGIKAASSARSTKIGVFSDGYWYLDKNQSWAWDGAPPDVFGVFGLGIVGGIPVTGDWNGDGKTEIGIYDNGIWYLDMNGNGQWDGEGVDVRGVFGVGLPNAVPVVGDWTGDGVTKIGVFSDGYWYLDMNKNWAWDGGTTDVFGIFGVGVPNVKPVTGNW